MKTTNLRRAVLCSAVLIALLLSAANAVPVRADDGPGHGTPGKLGTDAPDTDDSWFELLIATLETFELLLPM